VSSIPPQHGFTLLELLIVMAIISILSMVGVPSYQNYMIRSKVSQDFATAGKIKTMVEEYYAVTGVMPEKNEELGLGKEKTITGVRLEKVKIEDKPMPGTIKLHYDHKVALPQLGKDPEIKFVPEIVNGRVVWECKSGNMLDKYRPAQCRGDSKYPD
jgi:type IV pilus assembly protein PilA